MGQKLSQQLGLFTLQKLTTGIIFFGHQINLIIMARNIFQPIQAISNILLLFHLFNFTVHYNFIH